MSAKSVQKTPRSERRLGEDQKAWLVIGAIDVIATLAIVALYIWFMVHASA